MEKPVRPGSGVDFTRQSSFSEHESADGEMGLGVGVGGNLQKGGAGMATGSISAAGGDDIDQRTGNDLSGMEGQDPAQTMIHRPELDDQERLDLEAERRERSISEGRHDLGAESTELASADRAGTAGDVKAAKRLKPGECVITAFDLSMILQFAYRLFTFTCPFVNAVSRLPRDGLPSSQSPSFDPILCFAGFIIVLASGSFSNRQFITEPFSWICFRQLPKPIR